MAELTLTRHTAQAAPKVVTVCITGEVDQHSGRSAESYVDETLASEKPQHLLLDLSGLSFAGTSFFSSLLFWREELTKLGGTLGLFGLQQAVHSTMRMLALDRLVPINDDEQAALARLGKG